MSVSFIINVSSLCPVFAKCKCSSLILFRYFVVEASIDVEKLLKDLISQNLSL